MENGTPNKPGERITQVPFHEYLTLLDARDERDQLRDELAAAHLRVVEMGAELNRLGAESLERVRALQASQAGVKQFHEKWLKREAEIVRCLRALVETTRGPRSHEQMDQFSERFHCALTEAVELLAVLDAQKKT